MTDSPRTFDCACPCNACRFTVTTRPIARLFCHCLVCQQVYRQPFADVTAWRGNGVALPANLPIRFKRYKAPPAVRRGSCSSCGAPVVGFMSLVPGLQIAFIPARNFTDEASLPPPTVHIFYHRRVADIDDGLPKISGYWASELSVTRSIVGRLFGNRQ